MNKLKQSNIDQSNVKQKILSRNQWLIDNRISFLIHALKIRENIDITLEQAFEIVTQADPSPNNSAAQWVIECYCRDGFRWEDIQGKNTSKVFETLRLFSKFKRNLTIEQRNIYKYQSLSDVYQSVQMYHLDELEKIDNSKGLENSNRLELKGRELKHWEKEKAFANSYLVLDEPDLKIVVPLTREASQWWGKGTRWCTAAREQNMFDHYNQQAPLIIMLLKDHQGKSRKLQLWITEQEFQWMDETDGRITKEFVQSNWNKLNYIFDYSVQIYGGSLGLIADQHKTFSLCMLAVKQNGQALAHVPESLKNYELCRLACEQNGHALRDTPNNLITLELCAIACQENGYALRYVPEPLRVDELNYLACKKTGEALQYVPYNLRNEELCWIAIEQNGRALEFVPAKFVDEKISTVACEQNGRALEFVPDLEFITADLCKRAVTTEGSALQFVPDQFRTQELYMLACQNNGKTLIFVPLKQITQELCWVACKQNGLALSFVPDHFKTLELCKFAFEQNNNALIYVPQEFKINDFIKQYSKTKIVNWTLEKVKSNFNTILNQPLPQQIDNFDQVIDGLKN